MSWMEQMASNKQEKSTPKMDSIQIHQRIHIYTHTTHAYVRCPCIICTYRQRHTIFHSHTLFSNFSSSIFASHSFSSISTKYSYKCVCLCVCAYVHVRAFFFYNFHPLTIKTGSKPQYKDITTSINNNNNAREFSEKKKLLIVFVRMYVCVWL